MFFSFFLFSFLERCNASSNVHSTEIKTMRWRKWLQSTCISSITSRQSWELLMSFLPVTPQTLVTSKRSVVKEPTTLVTLSQKCLIKSIQNQRVQCQTFYCRSCSFNLPQAHEKFSLRRSAFNLHSPVARRLWFSSEPEGLDGCRDCGEELLFNFTQQSVLDPRQRFFF